MAAADTAKLLASLELQDKFTPGVNKALGSMNKLETGFGRIGGIATKGIGTAVGNLARLGVALGAVAGVAAVGFLGKSITAASDLNETINKSAVVFGKAQAAMLQFGKTAPEALGLSENAAIGAAASIGNLLLSTGTAPEKIEPMSAAIVKLASDLASFNNISPEEALAKLQSGLVGQERPLRELGVAISAASVDAEALALGFIKVNGVFTEGQKVQARYSLIFKQTATAQGDFARTSGGLANQQRILKANLEDTAAVIGTAVLPKVAELVKRINDLVTGHRSDIEAFAAQLPIAFDKALAFADKVPWGAIAKGLEQGAFFAGKLVDVFVSLPPEAQATIVALAGLNKLSGGAVSSIVGELGKGLIKGVLGLTAGVVNINAGVVNGGGVPPVVQGAEAVGSGIVATVATAAAGLVAILGAPLVASYFAEHHILGFEPGRVPSRGPTERAGGPIDVTVTGKAADDLAAVANAKVASQVAAAIASASTDQGRAADDRESKAIASFNRIGAALEGPVSSRLSSIASLIARFGYSPAEWQSIYARAAAAGGRSQINALAKEHNALNAIALADSETSKFLTGTAGPFFKDGKNQTRLLASLEADQAYFNRVGDTATAAKLGADIAALKLSPTINVTTNVTTNTSVSVRDVLRQTHTSNSYGTIYNGNAQ